jgi:hypothetical protein
VFVYVSCSGDGKSDSLPVESWDRFLLQVQRYAMDWTTEELEFCAGHGFAHGTSCPVDTTNCFLRRNLPPQSSILKTSTYFDDGEA